MLTIIASQSFAGAQGHNLLAHYLEKAGVRTAGWSASRFQKAAASLYRHAAASARGLAPEGAWNLLVANLLTSGACRQHAHFIWGDEGLMHASNPSRCLFTLHMPIEHWVPGALERMGSAKAIITMAGREADYIRANHPRLPVTFIPHGIDADFWQPDPARVQESPKIIAAVGRYMRNYEMLVRVAAKLLQRRPDVKFRWLTNPEFELPPEIGNQIPLERFELVKNLNAEELRRFYQESWLLFMPYNNVTASNTIVEAATTGLPVFTTRVGGMASYLNNDVAVLTENNDDDAMLAAIEHALDTPQWRHELARRSREHAVAHFSWQRVTELHRAFYRSLGL